MLNLPIWGSGLSVPEFMSGSVNSGWQIPDDTDSGVALALGIEVGVGYMEMDIEYTRFKNLNIQYELRGPYVELGFGIGEISKIPKLGDFVKSMWEKIPKRLRSSKVTPATDFVIANGGSIGELMICPSHAGKKLTPTDFDYSTWIYCSLGAELGIPAVDTGFICLVDKALWADIIVAKMGRGPSSDMLKRMFTSEVIAWAPYYGISAGIGIGVKLGFRLFQVTSRTAKPKGSTSARSGQALRFGPPRT
jgi:hypothetical protein